MDEELKSTQHPTREEYTSLAQSVTDLTWRLEKHCQICYLAQKATERFLGNAGQDRFTEEAMTEAFRQVQEEASPQIQTEQAACSQEEAAPWYTQEDTASHFAQNQTRRDAAHFQPFGHIQPEGEGDAKEIQGQVTNTEYLPVDNSTDQQALNQIIFGQWSQN